MAGETKKVSVDVHEFVRTRDALTSAYMSLSTSIDRAVKAYIEHTNVVLAGDASLDISMLQQPFDALAAPQLAQLALAHQQHDVQAAAPIETADGKKKRNYKPRDPNAPKRPLTAYFRYLQEQRAPLAQQMAKDNNGPSKPGDISKAATERWKSMSEEDQAPYKEAYQRALKDYEVEVASYKAGVEGADPAEEQQVNGAAQKEEDDESSTDSDESSSEEDAKPMPPPAPKVASPEVKKTPKSAMKKTKKAAAAEDVPATPQFSSINPSVPIPSSQRKSSSPELKRKASADAGDEGTKKKRGRKTKAEKEAEAAEAAAAVASTPVVPSSDAGNDKPKKDKKKKRKSEA
ncbi:hypothetical protein Q7P37_003770 [Cladosporium fusiforme]